MVASIFQIFDVGYLLFSSPIFLVIIVFQIWMFVDAIRREEYIWAAFIFIGSLLSTLLYYILVYRAAPSATRGFELPGAVDRRSAPLTVGYTARNETDGYVFGYEADLAVNTGMGANDDIASYKAYIFVSSTAGLGTPKMFATGSSPDSLAIGDFDGDHRPDIAVANQATNDVTILNNKAQ